MDTALQFVPIMIMGFAVALGLTPLSRQIAMRLGVVDKPTLARKIHKDHKPLMGGLAIVVGMVVSVLVFSPPQHLRELGAICASASLLALVGLLDDRFNLGVRVRLVAMIAAALLVIAFGIHVRLFGMLWLDVALTVVWITALTNALNFLDNMDGLSAGISVIASAFFLLIAFTQGQILVSLLAAAVLGSAMGFLAYNFNPASTFMGDMGALVLGFSLAVLGIKLQFAQQPLSITWLIPVMVLAVPIVDINLVVWTRLYEGRSPFEGGKDHTSHRIMALGLSQRLTIGIIYILCALFGGIGALMSASAPDVAIQLGALGVAFMLMLTGAMVWIRVRVQRRKEGA